MKNIIILILLATAFQSSCQPVSAGNNSIAYHDQTRKAFNVSVGSESVYAYFQNAEFILSYCGEVTIEIDGQSQTQNAVVCQYDPGVWTATLYNGDYVKVWTGPGIANTSINGEVRIFALQ